MTPVTFNNRKSPFFRALKLKVDNYFAENNIDPSGSKKLMIKGGLQVFAAALIYTVLVFFNPGPWISLGLCILFGVDMALIGFNVMHEGGHSSFSNYKWVNKASAYSLNLLGGNSYFWKIKHNVNHHTFTNIDGMDSDIDVEFFMRLHDEQPRYWFHRFQHIYWFVLYGISYFAWVYYQDFSKYFSGKVIPKGEKKKLAPKEHFIFWITKIFYTLVYIVLPIYMLGWVEAVIGYAIIAFVCGLFISVVFQLAHVVGDTQFPKPELETNKIDTEWAVHQINTTANFGTRSKFLFWMLGGLNFQVEHHLFPKISHIHYPKISELVKETCEQFNVTYIEYPTMFNALASHLVHIRRLGKA